MRRTWRPSPSCRNWGLSPLAQDGGLMVTVPISGGDRGENAHIRNTFIILWPPLRRTCAAFERNGPCGRRGMRNRRWGVRVLVCLLLLVTVFGATLQASPPQELPVPEAWAALNQ